VVRERWEGGSYITVVVPGRFRLDIEHEVNGDGLVGVDLRPARRRPPQPKQRRRRRGQGGGRKAA
jgi:hypothetical protein